MAIIGAGTGGVAAAYFLGGSFDCIGLGDYRLLAGLCLCGSFLGDRRIGSGFLGGSGFTGFGLNRRFLGNRLLSRDFLRRNVGGVGRRLLGCDLFGFRHGFLGRRIGLRLASLGALLGLLTGLRLLRVVARRTLAEARGVEEAQHTIGRLGADGQPVRDAVGVELHTLGRILRQQRIVGADLLDEAAIAGCAAVGDDDAVIGPLLGATASEANC